MPVRAGQLRHRVALQQNAATQDNFGVPSPDDWQDVATVWAAVEPITGRERYQNLEAQRVATLQYKIRMRYRAGITEKMRVLWGTRTFDIQAILNPDERNIMLELICEESPDA